MASTSSSSSKSTKGRKRPAPSSSINDSIDFTLECPICLDELTDPKVLICGHHICSPCSAKMAKSGDSGRFCYECPTCKRTTEVSKGLETNYGLRDALEKMKQMKDFYDMMEAERSRVESVEKENSADANNDFIDCHHCQKKCPAKEAFICSSASCAEKKRFNVCLTNYTKAREEIDVWDVKKFCALCSWRQHRDHSVEEMDKLALFHGQTTDATGSFILALKLNETLPQIVKSKTTQVDLFSTVKAQCESCFKDLMEKLCRPEKPLLKRDATTITDQMMKTWQQTKAFFDNEAQLSSLIEECRKKIFAAYNASQADSEKPIITVIQAEMDKLLGLGQGSEKPTTNTIGGK